MVQIVIMECRLLLSLMVQFVIMGFLADLIYGAICNNGMSFAIVVNGTICNNGIF